MRTILAVGSLSLLVHAATLLAQVQVPDGFEIVQITDDPFFDAIQRHYLDSNLRNLRFSVMVCHAKERWFNYWMRPRQEAPSN